MACVSLKEDRSRNRVLYSVDFNLSTPPSTLLLARECNELNNNNNNVLYVMAVAHFRLHDINYTSFDRLPTCPNLREFIHARRAV